MNDDSVGVADGWFDADAHVIEPPEQWAGYVPARFRDRAPRLERRGSSDWVVCDGEDLFPIGRLGGLARQEQSLRLSVDALEGTWEASIVPGAHDPAARVEAMALDGVTTALLFPTIAMTCYSVPDVELRWALLQAYNEWVSDLCAERPDALLSVCMIDPDDIARSLTEIGRAAERSQAAVLVPLWSDAPWPYAEEKYERLWAVAADLGLPVGFHAFASRSRHGVRRGRDLAVEAVVTRPGAVATSLVHLLFSGLFDRVSTLRWFSAENDAGWASYFLERADQLFGRAAGEFPIRRPPSEIFAEHVSLTFTAERVAVADAALIGTGNLLWGSDFPHNVTTWPRSKDVVNSMFDEFGTDADVRRALTSANARRLFTR